MGKVARWLRGLLGMKKDKESVGEFSSFSDKKEKKRKDHRSLLTQKRNNRIATPLRWLPPPPPRLMLLWRRPWRTSRGRGALFVTQRENWAAVKIQSVFRGYLARKERRALRGLVKLQAHIRGYLVRKRAAATLHSMQALIRAQAAVPITACNPS